MKRIIFGGGCFWGVEAYFKQLKGVMNTTVGYANGNFANPSYQDLIAGKATHSEAVEIMYNENIISLNELLDHLFRIIEPTNLDHQGGDFGHQYRTGIYYRDEEDYVISKNFINEQQKNYKQKIKVELVKEEGYYLAEDYHQDYLDKNSGGYCHVNLSLAKKGERK
ncbi:MAG TPA: peptide-methionine (S)-S-oxide reductase MsrA [Acholeplasmataceae bacterium]|nr:peptide-methionine (S)-S-oxide reductase MsrA [Acholeplasmataceae bacterium]